MGKQINSAKKMENTTKQSQDTLVKKESKKIDDYFNLGNKKRLREEPEATKDEGVLKVSSKSDNQSNNIAPISKDQAYDFKSKNSSSEKDLRRGSQSKENLKPNGKSNLDLSLEEDTENKPKKKKENSNICSICRDGGDLLLCDKCPKSFHTHCLKINRASLPDKDWYCPACLPKMEKQKQRESEFDERRKIRNEKKKLWRLKRKEELKSKSIDNPNFANIPLIDDNFIERLSIEKKKFENKQFLNNNSRIKLKSKMKCLSASKNKKKSVITNGSKKFMNDFIYKGSGKVNGLSKEKDSNSKSSENDKIIINKKNLNKNGELIEISINENIKNTNSSNKNNSSSKDNFKGDNFQEPQSFANIMSNKNKIHKIQIKYPIDDNVLYSNPEKYNLSQNYFNKPTGSKTIIPDCYFTKIIKIWDLLDTFKTIFNLGQFYPEDLFVALNYYGDEEISVLNGIHNTFMKVFYEQIKKKELNEFFDDKNLLMFKIAYENTKLENFKYLWIEIFRFLVESPFFNLMVNDEVKVLSKRLDIIKSTQYNLLSIDEKLLILEFLCNTVLDTDAIREVIKNEIEKKKELKAEIANLELELKSFESRKRELERQEKFTQPKQKIETLTKRLESLVEDNPNLSRLELTKLRKEIELEREQFKSVIKESENLEVNKGKLLSKMEKIELDLYNLGTIHKKLIGVDGLKNEYYFYNSIPNKIFKKCIKNKTDTKEKTFEWSEIKYDEEVKALLASLSEKGFRETNLAHKVKKLLNKKLKILPNQNASENKSEEEILNKLLSHAGKMLDTEEDSERRLLVDIFERLENDISEYLNQDKKEWESFTTRQDIKAFVNSSDSINELGKCLILLNERFKNPYKQNDYKTKVISDEEDYARGSVIDMDGKIDLNYIDEKKVLAPKAKVWSSEYLEIDLEEHFLSYLDNVRSLKSIILACIFYEGITADLIKRREVYKHFKRRDDSIVQNNIEPYLQQNKVNSSAESKKESLNFNNKKIITDIDEFYYDDEQFEIQYKINKEKNLKLKDPFNNPNTVGTRRSLRNTSGNGFLHNSNSTRDIKPKIKWNSECYVCEDGGDLILCEKCPNAAHLECISLTKEPDTWTCEQCLSKLVTRRLTRSNKI